MSYRENETWAWEMQRERGREILVLDFLVLLPVGVRPGYIYFISQIL